MSRQDAQRSYQHTASLFKNQNVAKQNIVLLFYFFRKTGLTPSPNRPKFYLHRSRHDPRTQRLKPHELEEQWNNFRDGMGE